MLFPSYFAKQFKYTKNRTIILKKIDDTERCKSLIS